MKLYWRLGWRNIWRNKRRSTITIAALAFSVALMVFCYGFMESYAIEMEKNALGLSLGHVQIHHPLYLADQNLFEVVEGADQLVQKLRDAGFVAAARSYGYGLMGSDRSGKSAGVRLQGVSLADEPDVTRLHLEKNFLAGRYLSERRRSHVFDLPPSGGTFDSPASGVTPPGEAPAEEPAAAAFADPLGGDDELDAAPAALEVGEVVLGKNLAASLGVGPGEVVHVVTMAADGTLGNELLDVVGVLKNYSEAEDRILAVVRRADYQQLFKLPPGQAHEIAVRLPAGADLEASRAAIAAIAGDAGKARTWREIVPALAEMMDLMRALTPILLVALYLGGALVIMNAMLMMVFERIREFGVMKAVGLKGRQLLALIYFETFWMCAVAAVFGLAVGIPLTLWVGRVGIDVTAFAPDGFAISGTVLDPVMYAVLTREGVYMPLLALFAVAFLAVVYPAVKAAVIEPVKAIHHI